MRPGSHRVVITGIGAVTPFGVGVEAFWEGLRSGRSAVRRLEGPEWEALPTRIGAVVPEFDAAAHMDARAARRTARFGQFAVAAAREALRHAGLDLEREAEDAGVVLGTAGGLFASGYQEKLLEEKGPRRVDPLFVTRHGPHMAAARVARELGLRGPNTTINSACASGADAIGQALNLIRLGHAPVLLAGGSEAITHPVTIASLGIVGALSQRNEEPERASRPFDRDRDGFVLGEGAGVLVLESEEHARARGARILAELAGAGWSFDATDDTAPDAEGQALAMARALRDAGCRPEDVDWVKAHGTSTPLNDRTETAAIKLVFGEHARRVPVSSMKSMIGHAASASGAVEAVGAVLAMLHGTIPPTINYETPDPDCDLDYVPNAARPARLRTVLVNAFGLGGQNAALILRAYEP
ncbi:MAG: beta-ketoacyl-[acyl-carrier-protein] synthase family protein [Firmicutes bacterium]|nr:beta-ketoacyl-[acyl-carrier-protein] synthase family protein [Bacillota bacterium]